MVNREYPDLPFSVPASYGSGRDGYQVQYIVIHYTAGSEGPTSAEDGAAYDRRRTDGTSCHYFVDSNSIVQEVYTWDRANSCYRYGNRMGIQYELCGTVQTRAQWLDGASYATLKLAARQAARDCRKYGLPAKKIGPAEMRAGQKGICGHADVTLAYGLGDHMDPGSAFPWDVFIQLVADELNPSATTPVPTRELEDDMLFYAPNPDGSGGRWGVVSGGVWVEYDDQDEGTATALQGGNYTTINDATYVRLRKPFLTADRVLDGVTD